MAISSPEPEAAWEPERRPFGKGDVLALATWTSAVALFFRDAVGLRRALFYFDITEINYPYRDFLAREMRLGRFSRWHPGLYGGLPLYSESQAGYLHPLKYLLYPWLPTWQAFNLDTVLSVWLTGLATYGWLRRHVGPVGALTGAGIFGLGGFVWAHLIHTSMTNALISVPLAFWALEAAWDSGRWRPVALGALAIACQVFAGHLQDTLLTGSALVLYGIYRAATAPSRRAGAFAIGAAVAMLGLAVMIAAVQWVPSKELLDRSPRARGLAWEDQTYGSWGPELLPALVVREAYGTRARDTDWMDGFYPYHEMNAYLGVVGLALAAVGASAYRDRWVGFWLILAGLGSLLMLGRFTVLFDLMPRVPILGSSRIPVRYHLWVSLAVAALAAVGADRLARPGRVRLRGAVLLIAGIAAASLPILAYVYAPVWADPARWNKPEHLLRYRWLAQELALAAGRTLALALLGYALAARAARARDPRRRLAWAAGLPILAIADLLGAHLADVPTVAPSFWTVPPASARRILADPKAIRVLGVPGTSAGEPGYDWGQVDFYASRDTLGWSLPPVWGLASSAGETPIRPRRWFAYHDRETQEAALRALFDVEGVSYVLTRRSGAEGPIRLRDFDPPERSGAALLHHNPGALPRARLVGRPEYARDEAGAIAAVRRLGPAIRDRLVVEDPTRPLAPGAAVAGEARIVREVPERVEVATDSATASYLLLADSFDPGWSATVDGRPAPIRPAYVTFRAVYLGPGRHRVVFTYEPAGFRAGLAITAAGLLVAVLLLAGAGRPAAAGPAHGDAGWPRSWPAWGLGLAVLIVAVSAFIPAPAASAAERWRWSRGVHRFTWGSGIEAMRPPRPPGATE